MKTAKSVKKHFDKEAVELFIILIAGFSYGLHEFLGYAFKEAFLYAPIAIIATGAALFVSAKVITLLLDAFDQASLSLGIKRSPLA